MRQNLIGNIYGTWKILEYDKEVKHMHYWKCICTHCSFIRTIHATSLLYRIPPKCSKCIPKTFQYEQQIGNWIILGFAGTKKYKGISYTKQTKSNRWICQCICGKIKILFQSQLIAIQNKKKIHCYHNKERKENVIQNIS